MPIHGYPGNIITANPPTPSVSSASGVWTTEQQLQNMTAGNWPMAATQISRSLRFNSADSAYLNRTPASASNRKTWTWSGWVKISSLPVNNALFAAYKGSGSVDNEFFALYFSSGTLRAGGYSTTYLESSAVYRDFSAWYHVVCTIDTTSATSNNRVRLYINGFEITAFQTRNNPNQNTDLGVNQNTLHQIGQNGGFGNYFNGYMTEVHFIDGQALTPASFGQTNSATGVWEPRQYTGPYGTNGFYLNFSDNSGTTSTTLGKDSSGNGNNWTPNNFSVTAGAGNDSLVDSPTAYGTDTGAGGEVRGNYCTLNPLNNPGGSTFANGNLDVTTASSTGGRVVGTVGVSSGKWYWEITPTSVAGLSLIGIAAASRVSSGGVGDFSDEYAYQNNGNKYSNSVGAAYGASYTANDVIGVALDLDAGTLVFYKNNSSQGTAYSSISGTFVPAMSDGQNANSSAFVCNFGQRPFAYTAPSGFKALVTTNLPTPTIGATSTTQANDYFNAVLYTGNTPSTNVITGVGFAPDFVWVKSRTVAESHNLVDKVRGNNLRLKSNETTAEASATFTLDSDGFTVGANSESNTGSMVGWAWKANGAGSSNTQGTITSTVSVNTTAGFSVVTYTGNGLAAATVGHGLGATPAMIIVKQRNTTGPWYVKHTSLASNNNLLLNGTDAAYNVVSASSDGGLGNLSSSTTFGFLAGSSDASAVNENGGTFVAYCFAAVAGYSAFGSYTGNGSSDGPFIYTGFRPRYILIKKSSAASSTVGWQLFDTARSPTNVAYLPGLWADSSAAESGSAYGLDILSNGFKIRLDDTNNNANNQTMIYAAFAESPFKYALAR